MTLNESQQIGDLRHLVKALAERIDELSMQVKHLRAATPMRGQVADIVWGTPDQAAAALGLASGNALRIYIKKGRLSPYNKRTGRGSWINKSRGDRPTYRVHIPNAIAEFNSHA